MKPVQLSAEPYNLVIAGVGGQGNVMVSRLLGRLLAEQGYQVVIGETFGAAQRGGSVNSQLRISPEKSYSPQMAKGQAQMIVSMEPTETLRMLMQFGNSEVDVICNTRPIFAPKILAGEQDYPSQVELEEKINGLCRKAWYIDAIGRALEEFDSAIFGNVITLGAIAGTKALPISRENFEVELRKSMPADKIDINLKAFDLGWEMVS